MSKLVDPHICPDCRAPLDTSATCTGCGLRLTGPGAAELWQLMQQADRIVESLRGVPAAAPGAGPAPTPAPLAPMPSAPPAVPRRHLPAISVPVVLLGLGALCLLVAAIVFVAVAWGSLGLAAKTAILLVVTAGFAVAAVVLTRRDLRWAAETFWLIVAAMLVLDIVAAWAADLAGFESVDGRHVAALVGAALLGLPAAVALWARQTPLKEVYGLIPVAGFGAVLVALGEAWLSDANPAASAVAVPVLSLFAIGLVRVLDGALRAHGYAVSVAAVLGWLVLVGHGVDRMAVTDDQRTWWSELAGWPLLVAALLAATPTVVPRFPDWGRMTAATASLVTLMLFVVGPGADATVQLLVLSAISVVLAAITASAPRVWRVPAGVFTAFGLLVATLWLLGRPLNVIFPLPTTGPPDADNLGLHLPGPGSGPAPWTALVTALVVGATAAGLLRHLRPAERRAAAGNAWVALGPGVLALGATTGLIETEPTLLAAVLAWSSTLALTAGMAVTVRHQMAPLAAVLLLSGYLIVVGLRLAVPSHLLAAALATVIALGCAAAYWRTKPETLRRTLAPSLAAVAVLTGGFAATHWPYLLSGRGDAAGLTLALFAAAVLAAARAAGRDEVSRVTLEATAAVAGLVAVFLPTSGAVVAFTVTVLGTAIAVVATLNRDRDLAGWVAVGVLGIATLIRVVEDIRAPELYTIPAALLLLGAGVWRLRTDGRAGSVRALSSGLVLALVPSLLLALDEPVSLRGALIAAASLAVLGAGVVLHWAAPLVAGALATAVLAVRHLGPVVEGLPRWISLGTVGVLLLVVGITWEARLRNLRAASRYLASLR